LLKINGEKKKNRLITTDINKFSEALAELYGNLGKPALDLWLFSRELESNMGESGVGALWWAYYATLNLMRLVTPNFGKLRADEAALEGEFRFAHSRVITNAEEIAFYGGQDVELGTLNTRYLNLVRQVNYILNTRIWFNMFGKNCRFLLGCVHAKVKKKEDLLLKYAWTTIGLLAQAVPVFFPEAVLLVEATKTLKDGETAAGRTEKYVTNKRLMQSLADAGSRLMYSYKVRPAPPNLQFTYVVVGPHGTRRLHRPCCRLARGVQGHFQGQVRQGHDQRRTRPQQLQGHDRGQRRRRPRI